MSSKPSTTKKKSSQRKDTKKRTESDGQPAEQKHPIEIFLRLRPMSKVEVSITKKTIKK